MKVLCNAQEAARSLRESDGHRPFQGLACVVVHAGMSSLACVARALKAVTPVEINRAVYARFLF